MCDAWIERCNAVDSFYEKYQDGQMNNTLYVLTLVTVLVMPTQVKAAHTAHARADRRVRPWPRARSRALHIGAPAVARPAHR